MTRWFMTAILALLVGLGASLYGLYQTAEELGSTEAQVDAAEARAKAAEAALDDVRAQVRQVQRRYNAQAKELDDALEKNREWAAGRTPSAVVDSLCRSGNCPAPDAL